MTKLLFGILAAGFFFVLFTVFGTLMGALSGWVVGLFFGETILTFFSYIFGASHGFQMWQIGASLGFMSGFLKKPKLSLVSDFKNLMGKFIGKQKAIAEAEFLLNPRQPKQPKQPNRARG